MPRYLGLIESNNSIDVGSNGLYEVFYLYAESIEEAAVRIAEEFNREGKFTVHGLAASGDFTSSKQTRLVATRIVEPSGS